MAMTAHDLLLDADAFRAAYPSWPHPEPPKQVFEPVPEREDWRSDRADYDEGSGSDDE